MRATLIVSFSLVFPLLAFSQTMPGGFGASPAQPVPLRLPESGAKAAVVAKLPSLRSAELAVGASDRGDGPLAVGLVRQLPEVVSVRTRTPHSNSTSETQWIGSVEVEGAVQLRLQLTEVIAPKEAVFTVASSDGREEAFTVALAYENVLWTPSIFGDTITLRVWSPSEAVSLNIRAVAELTTPRNVSGDGTACLLDVVCQGSSILDEASAIASYEYIKGGTAYVCSGGLILDRARTFAPYFLTANHCVSSNAVAATVEAYWDYRAPSCGGTAPPRNSVPRSVGATLLATAPSSDVTLLRLSSVPGSRYWLGWSLGELQHGARIHRISHPSGQKQRYAEMVVDVMSPACIDWPRPITMYSQPLVGSSAGGSSGAPVLYGDGFIVGQLKGACGPDTNDPCNYSNRHADGALFASWSTLKPFLDPDPPGTCDACVLSNTTACVIDGRFKITLDWFTSFGQPQSGTGKVIRYAESRPDVSPTYGTMTENTFFSMYNHAPNSVEVIVRIFRGVTINDKWWVFITGFSDTGYTIKITDTQTCRTWQRTNTHGQVTLARDFEAFPFP